MERQKSSKKVAPTELELVQRQAKKMLKDMKRLQNTQKTSSDRKEFKEGVDVWKDSDFFFSVVFQSATQKYQFLEQLSKQFGLGIDQCRSEDAQIQVVNGLVLAEKLGYKISSEKSPDLPYPNLNLASLALDNEEF